MLDIRAKSFALVLVLLFNLAATAETVTEFQQDGIAKEEVTLVFEESDSDDSVSLEYPNVEVLDASFKIRGTPTSCCCAPKFQKVYPFEQ